MKLRCSNTVIETDHISYTQKLNHGTVRVHFISDDVLDVVCGMKTTDPRAATFDGTVEQLLNTIENTDKLKQD